MAKLTFFFYKHKAYKDMNPQNWPKIKHILSLFFHKKKGEGYVVSKNYARDEQLLIEMR